RAHEDDAQRAVRAGLGMIEAVAQLNTRLEPERGVQLAVRLGCHTGLVVVGDMGGGPRQERSSTINSVAADLVRPTIDPSGGWSGVWLRSTPCAVPSTWSRFT